MVLLASRKTHIFALRFDLELTPDDALRSEVAKPTRPRADLSSSYCDIYML